MLEFWLVNVHSYKKFSDAADTTRSHNLRLNFHKNEEYSALTRFSLLLSIKKGVHAVFYFHIAAKKHIIAFAWNA